MSYNMKLVTGFYPSKFPISPISLHKYVAKNNISLAIGIECGIDYIIIKYKIGDEYKEIKYVAKKPYIFLHDNMGVLSMLRELVPDMEFQIETHESLLAYEKHLVGKLGMFNRRYSFEIVAASESIRDVTGFEHATSGYYLNSKSKEFFIIHSMSACYMQLTPVLYLTSNIGTTVHSYVGKDMVNQKILMRINNHFIPGLPIVCNNFEFSSIIPSHALSDVWFKLVDANFRSVKLLNPMFLSATAKGINERFVERPIFVEEEENN
jgi:hypothetical protein